MKSFIIRGIDSDLDALLKKTARERGKSVNQLIIETIRNNFSGRKKDPMEHTDLDHLFGRWNEEEYRLISTAVNGARQIDTELWEK